MQDLDRSFSFAFEEDVFQDIAKRQNSFEMTVFINDDESVDSRLSYSIKDCI